MWHRTAHPTHWLQQTTQREKQGKTEQQASESSLLSTSFQNSETQDKARRQSCYYVLLTAEMNFQCRTSFQSVEGLRRGRHLQVTMEAAGSQRHL